MIEQVDLTEWKTKKEVLKELEAKGIVCDERTFRMFVEQFNKQYCDGLNDSYIVHGGKGYKITKDASEIERSISDLKKRGLNMLWKHSQASKAMGIKDNLKMDLEAMDII